MTPKKSKYSPEQLKEIASEFIKQHDSDKAILNLMSLKFKELYNKKPICVSRKRIINGVEVKYLGASIYFGLLEMIESGELIFKN